MRNKKIEGITLVLVLVIAAALLAAACVTKGPTPELLNELTAATNKAAASRQKAVNVQGQTYFPDEWGKAEADNDAAKKVDRTNVDSIKSSIALYGKAADAYDDIASKSSPLYAKDMEEGKAALEEIMARAEKSRQNASDNQASAYFPEEWDTAEGSYNSASSANKEQLAELQKAIDLFTSAADAYDEIAAKSAPLWAADKAKVQKDLQDAVAREDKARKDAQGIGANKYFPDEWQAAEDADAAAKAAPKDSLDEMKEAAALYAAAAELYDELIKDSGPMFAKDGAQKGLTDAQARAEKARASAVSAGGQANFPNEWKAAEDKNNGGKSAPKNTADEVKAATALFNSAADGYDNIAKRGIALNKEKEDANKALQAAIAKMDKSRSAAVSAKAQDNAPDQWKAAEAKGTTAKGAKRGTPAEMKAAVPLYNSAADAYDVAAKTQGSKGADDAKVIAEKERKAALDAKADVAVKADFDKAEAVYQAAAKDYGSKSFGPAADKYKQSGTQFAAVAKTAEGKRSSAENLIDKAREKSLESAALAANPGSLIKEDDNETL